MTPLAYVLLVAIPLSALGTIALALRRGRPRPGQTWETPRIRTRLAELATAQDAEGRRERRALRTELMRRGHRD